jgi:hypothetical protein
MLRQWRKAVNHRREHPGQAGWSHSAMPPAQADHAPEQANLCRSSLTASTSSPLAISRPCRVRCPIDHLPAHLAPGGREDTRDDASEHRQDGRGEGSHDRCHRKASGIGSRHDHREDQRTGPRQSRGLRRMAEHACRWKLAPSLDQRGRVAPGHDAGASDKRGRITTLPGPWPAQALWQRARWPGPPPRTRSKSVASPRRHGLPMAQSNPAVATMPHAQVVNAAS